MISPLLTGWNLIKLRGLGVHGLSELDAKLFPETLKLGKVLVVLALVLDLGLDAWMGTVC